VAFACKYVSPRMAVSKDWRQYAKIKKAWVRLRDVVGTVSFKLLGTSKDEAFSAEASGTISPGASNTGIGWDLVGEFLVGSTNGTPTIFASENILRFLTINSLLRDVQFTISTSGDNISDKFTLTGLAVEGYITKTSPPSDFKLTT